MDYLAASGLEPQLAIPVIVMVVGALLVYVFGFQKSEEPSLEHLAVLQSTSSYKARSVSNLKSKNNNNNNNNTKSREKSSQNGHVVHDKERNSSGKKKENAASNKENKPPRIPQATLTPSTRKVKQEVMRPEDFDSGEWIQAVSRKDKKKQVKKDEPKENTIIIPKADQASGKNKETPAVVETQKSEETVLKEAQVQVQSQTTQTTPKPTPEKKPKKGAKDASTTTGSSTSSPAKQKSAKEPKQEKKAPEVVPVNGVSEDATVETPEASPAKKQSVSEDTPAEQPKGYVAFDEMGDTNVDAWEEAKSRGNKKRRARKD